MSRFSISVTFYFLDCYSLFCHRAWTRNSVSSNSESDFIENAKWFIAVAFSACRKRSAVSVIRGGGLDPSGAHEGSEANFLHSGNKNKQCVTHHRQRRQGLSDFINYKCIHLSLGGERGLVVGRCTCNPEVQGSNPPPCH